jgi:hypothetical protein
MNHKIITLEGYEIVNKNTNLSIANRKPKGSVPQKADMKIIGNSPQTCLEHVSDRRGFKPKLRSAKKGHQEELLMGG